MTISSQDDGVLIRVSPFVFLAVLLRHLRLMGAVMLVGLTIGTLWLVVVARGWTASSTFMPEVDASASAVASLAAQFGLPFGAVESGESLDFYAGLVESRALLERVAQTEYRWSDDGDMREGSALQWLSIDEGDDDALHDAVEALRRRIDVSLHLEQGTITLTTRAPSPELAEALNAAILEHVGRFNVQTRQSRARAEAEFVGERLADAEVQLRAAEREMEQFLADNRTYQTSPQLSFEASRLQRRLDLAQQVYLSLAQAREQAAIEAVRNTPVLTIIDAPSGSAEQVRRILKTMVIALFGSALLAITAAFGREYLLRYSAEHPEEVSEASRLAPAWMRRMLARWAA